MICHTSADLPRSLRGYACWLQLLHVGEWYDVCELRPTYARQVLRWTRCHPAYMLARVRIEKVG